VDAVAAKYLEEDLSDLVGDSEKEQEESGGQGEDDAGGPSKRARMAEEARQDRSKVLEKKRSTKVKANSATAKATGRRDTGSSEDTDAQDSHAAPIRAGAAQTKSQSQTRHVRAPEPPAPRASSRMVRSGSVASDASSIASRTRRANRKP
jgi:hypothetical protein